MFFQDSKSDDQAEESEAPSTVTDQTPDVGSKIHRPQPELIILHYRYIHPNLVKSTVNSEYNDIHGGAELISYNPNIVISGSANVYSVKTLKSHLDRWLLLQDERIQRNQV